MKRRRLVTVAFLVGLIAAFGLVGCASPALYQMESGERTAGAEGQLSITSDQNGNQLVELNVAHLPQPSRLSEGMAIYTVWIRPEESGQYYNMGRLRLNDDRTGVLSFTTPFSAYDMLITAEARPDQMSPSDEVVLRRSMGGSGSSSR